MSASINWGRNDIPRGMMTYEDKVRFAMKQVGLYWAAVLEAYAKENAPWTDQTGAARQSLHAWVEDLAKDTVTLFLSHGVKYGLYLEARFSGAYSVIWPTIEAHLDAIAKM